MCQQYYTTFYQRVSGILHRSYQHLTSVSVTLRKRYHRATWNLQLKCKINFPEGIKSGLSLMISCSSFVRLHFVLLHLLSSGRRLSVGSQPMRWERCGRLLTWSDKSITTAPLSSIWKESILLSEFLREVWENCQFASHALILCVLRKCRSAKISSLQFLWLCLCSHTAGMLWRSSPHFYSFDSWFT